MNKLFISLLATCLIASAASAQLQTLTTTFQWNEDGPGQMFDIQATNTVEICSFDLNLDSGIWDLEVYTVTSGSSYTGLMGNAAAWTLLGSATGVVSNGEGVPTPLPIPIATPIAAGTTRGFYVTVTNSVAGGLGLNYLEGFVQHAVFAGDANITTFEGRIRNYPFLNAGSTPYVWNGNINYVVGSGCPALPLPLPWQVNSPISSLDIDGVQGTAYRGAVSSTCIGGTSNLNSSSTPGTLTDVAFNFTNSAPWLAPSTADNTVNVDIFHPTLDNLNGPHPAGGMLFLKPHPGAYTCPIPTGAAMTGSAQQFALDATNPDGYTLSQACEINVTANAPLVLEHEDDDFIQVFLNAAPLCGGSVDFYGTSYTDLFSNSNGTVGFTAGNGDFSATSGEWQTDEPKIGIGTDLRPNLYGTVTVTKVGPGLSGSTGSSHIVVSYADVTEWGTSGMGVSSWDIILNGPNGHEIANFTTDGTWAFQACVGGITLGSAGTHPALVSFDTLFGAGTQTNTFSTDSVIDENTSGMLINTTGWTTIQFPSLDGSSYIVH